MIEAVAFIQSSAISKKLIIAKILICGLISLGAIAMTGCASMRESGIMLRDHEPILSVTTLKTVDDFIGCLHPKMMGVRPPVYLMKDGPSTVLRMSSMQNTVLLVSATPFPNGGANVEVRARFKFAWGVDGTVEAVQSCK